MQKADVCQFDVLSDFNRLDVYQQTDLQLIWAHIRPYHVASETTAGQNVIHYSAQTLLDTRNIYEDTRKKHNIYLIHSKQELQQTIYADFRLNAVYHLSGGDGIQTLQDVDKLYDAGFRSIQPVREFSNHIAQSHRTPQGGISEFAKDLLPYIQSKRMIIDVA